MNITKYTKSTFRLCTKIFNFYATKNPKSKNKDCTLYRIAMLMIVVRYNKSSRSRIDHWFIDVIHHHGSFLWISSRPTWRVIQHSDPLLKLARSLLCRPWIQSQTRDTKCRLIFPHSHFHNFSSLCSRSYRCLCKKYPKSTYTIVA